jgi:hypothetical protein
MENQIIDLSPIDQTAAYSKMSPRYGFISTADLIGTLQTKGWNVVAEDVARVRTDGKQGFQKHLLKLENPNLPDLFSNTDQTVRPQLVVLNSHDGSTSTRLFFGLLRFACLNGIIAGNAFKDIRVIHSKNFTSKLSQGVDLVTENIPDLFSTIETLSQRTFTPAALKEFVRTCVDYKLRNVKNLTEVYYNTATPLRRFEDKGTDAWTTLNRLQESLIKGGIAYQHKTDVFETDPKSGIKMFCGTEERTRRTSAVRSIPQTINLNRLVFDKALELTA